MAFFDKISETLSKGSKTLIDKTKDLTDIAKLNSQISAEENKIRDAYEALGKAPQGRLIFPDNADGTEGSTPVLPFFAPSPRRSFPPSHRAGGGVPTWSSSSGKRQISAGSRQWKTTPGS